MKTINNKIIAWGKDDYNMLGLIRQLGPNISNFTSLIFGGSSICKESKYNIRYKVCKTIEDSLHYLLDKYSKDKYKAILIVSSDEVITYIDKNREVLEPYFLMPGTSKRGDVQKYIDKYTMTNLAKSIGIVCPKSKLIKWNFKVGGGLTYPQIIKPTHQQEGCYNEFKFKVIGSSNELKRTLRFVRRSSTFILQDYINKEYDILVYGARMADSKTVIAGALIRFRQLYNGESSFAFITDKIPLSINVNKINEYLEYIDYYGPFSFEYGQCENKSYFYEVNLRNDGTSHCFFQCGANIPLAYVLSVAGLDYSDVQTKVVGDRYFIDELFDISSVFTRKISYNEWRNDMDRSTVFKYYDENDPNPWRYMKKRRWVLMLKGLFIKQYRMQIVRFMDVLGLRK